MRRALIMILVLLPGAAWAAQGDEPQRQTFYVNNEVGSDRFDGLSPQPLAGGQSGPFATIMHAVRKATVGAKIVLACTAHDYREGVEIEGYHKGRADLPLVIEGQGATVSGLVSIASARWTQLKDDVYWFENRDANGVPGPMPNSNWLGFEKCKAWFPEPQAPLIFFLNGKPGPHSQDLDGIPVGGFFYDAAARPRRLYFRLPQGAAVADCNVEMPINRGVYVSDDYVVVRNLASKYSQDDGFAGFWGQGVVFQNINGSYNCDQGISFHGTSTTFVDGGLFEHNGGCGIVDVMSSVTVYRNVTVRDNLPIGALFNGHAHTMLGCRIYRNKGWQVEAGRKTAINLTNCLIDGSDANGPRWSGVQADIARLDHCTIVNCATGVRWTQCGSIENSIIAQCTGAAIVVAKPALGLVGVRKTLLGLGTITLDDRKIDRAKWDDAVKDLKEFKDILLDPPALVGPVYRLPEDSPHYRAADSNMVLGAVVKEFAGWNGPSPSTQPEPHP